MSEKRFIVFNTTDGFTASPFDYTEAEANEFIKKFPKRYEMQGYYRTGKGEKISPYDVILTKEEIKE